MGQPTDRDQCFQEQAAQRQLVSPKLTGQQNAERNKLTAEGLSLRQKQIEATQTNQAAKQQLDPAKALQQAQAIFKRNGWTDSDIVICRRKSGRGFWLVSVVSGSGQMGFEFQGRTVAQRRVKALGVVEGFDVVEE